MSDCFKPTCYNNRGKQNKWINLLHEAHDLICFCPQATKHLLLALAEKEEKIEVTIKEKNKILQCLSTTEEDNTTHGDIDGLDEVGLEALFAEDGEKEDG